MKHLNCPPHPLLFLNAHSQGRSRWHRDISGGLEDGHMKEGIAGAVVKRHKPELLVELKPTHASSFDHLLLSLWQSGGRLLAAASRSTAFASSSAERRAAVVILSQSRWLSLACLACTRCPTAVAAPSRRRSDVSSAASGVRPTSTPSGPSTFTTPSSALTSLAFEYISL